MGSRPLFTVFVIAFLLAILASDIKSVGSDKPERPIFRYNRQPRAQPSIKNTLRNLDPNKIDAETGGSLPTPVRQDGEPQAIRSPQAINAPQVQQPLHDPPQQSAEPRKHLGGIKNIIPYDRPNQASKANMRNSQQTGHYFYADAKSYKTVDDSQDFVPYGQGEYHPIFNPILSSHLDQDPHEELNTKLRESADDPIYSELSPDDTISTESTPSSQVVSSTTTTTSSIEEANTEHQPSSESTIIAELNPPSKETTIDDEPPDDELPIPIDNTTSVEPALINEAVVENQTSESTDRVESREGTTQVPLESTMTMLPSESTMTVLPSTTSQTEPEHQDSAGTTIDVESQDDATHDDVAQVLETSNSNMSGPSIEETELVHPETPTINIEQTGSSTQMTDDGTIFIPPSSIEKAESKDPPLEEPEMGSDSLDSATHILVDSNISKPPSSVKETELEHQSLDETPIESEPLEIVTQKPDVPSPAPTPSDLAGIETEPPPQDESPEQTPAQLNEPVESPIQTLINTVDTTTIMYTLFCLIFVVVLKLCKWFIQSPKVPETSIHDTSAEFKKEVEAKRQSLANLKKSLGIKPCCNLKEEEEKLKLVNKRLAKRKAIQERLAPMREALENLKQKLGPNIDSDIKCRKNYLANLKKLRSLQDKNSELNTKIKFSRYEQLMMIRNFVNLDDLLDLMRDIEFNQVANTIQEATTEMRIEIEVLKEQIDLFRNQAPIMIERYRQLSDELVRERAIESSNREEYVTLKKLCDQMDLDDSIDDLKRKVADKERETEKYYKDYLNNEYYINACYKHLNESHPMEASTSVASQ